MTRIRTVLLCHHDSPIHYDGIARWLANWSDLRGIVVVEEPASQIRKRLRREAKRVGLLRLFDVLAFRFWYRLWRADADSNWLASRLDQLRREFSGVPSGTPVLRTASPNSPECRALLAEARPDVAIALVKSMLAERIFAIPSIGTFVLHPGICPEYRNSHGCFWALASDDLENVGMTMLRIDRGVDTGPVFGYFHTTFDDYLDSHVQIQHAVVLDNLPAIAQRLQEVAAGTAPAIPIEGRRSQVWGQPWLSAWLRWKRHARRRRNARLCA